MIKKVSVALSLALMTIPFAAATASAQDIVESEAADRVECMVIMTFDEGHNWQDCLS